MILYISFCVLLLCSNGILAVDWNSSLKRKISEYGTQRQYCEYPVTEGGVTVQLKVLPGSSFDTLDCFHCECKATGLHCQGVGVNGWSLSGPRECTVVADGCSPMFVLRTNNKIDCFTRRHVGQLPNGERGYTVLGHRGASPPQMKKYRRIKPALNIPSDGTAPTGTTPVSIAKSASYRADTSVFRSAAIRPEDKFSNNHNQDSVPSSTFLASRLTRKWPVNKSSAYRQTQISSYPSKFKTGDRKMSKSETMVTSQSDSISDQADPIAAMIAGNSANYVVDKSIGLMPTEQLLLPRPSPLIMARDTLIPNSDFRKSWKKMVL